MAKHTSNNGRKVGMSNHPLQQENDRQKKISKRGIAKVREDPHSTTGSQRGHRLSRTPGGRSTSEPDARYARKGAKGGKSGGSRAGLLSTGSKA